MKISHKHLPKNNPLVLGFLISLIGTLPLGYINIIALQILLEKGNWATIEFILGTVVIEYLVLKTVSYGAKWVVRQKKLCLLIDIFMIVFFIAIACYFFSIIGHETNAKITPFHIVKFPFFLGLLANTLNFMQWTYWSGVYLYLLRTEKIKMNKYQNNIFILGALCGTFMGMLLFANSGNYFLIGSKVVIFKYLNSIFTLLFSLLALIQIVSFFSKHKKNENLE